MEIEAISSLRSSYQQPTLRMQDWKNTDAAKLQSDHTLTVGNTFEDLGVRTREQSRRGQENGASRNGSGQEEADQRTLELIQSKISMGTELTPSEALYLQKFDPGEYRKVEAAKQEEKDLQNAVDRARTPEAVIQAKFNYQSAAIKLINSGTLKIPEDLQGVTDDKSEEVAKLYRLEPDAVAKLLYGSEEESRQVAGMQEDEAPMATGTYGLAGSFVSMEA